MFGRLTLYDEDGPQEEAQDDYSIARRMEERRRQQKEKEAIAKADQEAEEKAQHAANEKAASARKQRETVQAELERIQMHGMYVCHGNRSVTFNNRYTLNMNGPVTTYFPCHTPAKFKQRSRSINLTMQLYDKYKPPSVPSHPIVPRAEVIMTPYRTHNNDGRPQTFNGGKNRSYCCITSFSIISGQC